MTPEVFADLIARMAVDRRFATAVLDDPDVLTTSFGLGPDEVAAVLAAAGRRRPARSAGALRPWKDLADLGPERRRFTRSADAASPTKILWPFEPGDMVVLTEHEDGTRTADYVDDYDNHKIVLIRIDGSRDQTMTTPSGQVWHSRQEITADGIYRNATTLPSDNTLWTVDIHPGAITHSISYAQPDGSSTETTYFARNVTKSVDRAVGGSARTVWTNADGVQRITTT